MPGIRRHHPIWTPGWPWWPQKANREILSYLGWSMKDSERQILDMWHVRCKSATFVYIVDQSLRLLRTAMAMLLDHRQWKGRLTWKWCPWTKGEGAWKSCWIHGYPPLMVLQILFMYIHIHLFAWKKFWSRPSDKAWKWMNKNPVNLLHSGLNSFCLAVWAGNYE